MTIFERLFGRSSRKHADWGSFAGSLMAQSVVSPLPPQLCLCYKTSAMANDVITHLPSAARPLISDTSHVIPFSNGSGTVQFFVYEGANIPQLFENLIFSKDSHDYGLQVVVTNGCAIQIPEAIKPGFLEKLKSLGFPKVYFTGELSISW